MAKRILISGALACQPLWGSGNSWAFLQYVLGFRHLGFDAYYVEELDPAYCIDEGWNRAALAASANARYFRALMERFGLCGRAALIERGGKAHVGLSKRDVEKIAREADLLINFSGRLQIREILEAVRRRIYFDMDPGYTGIWHEGYGADMNLKGHDLYVTVGLNLGQPDCQLPACGIAWEKTLPPVVLEEWVTTEPPGDAYTTVAEWRGFSPVEWRGVWYHPKADEFRRVIELPARVRVPLELCVSMDCRDPDLQELKRHGWRIVPPAVHAASPDSYRDYLFRSRGEFTVVKSGYAWGRTGWFSDRSACYLAAGRPVIVQDTGIGKYLPTGEGLLTFRDLDGAVEAIERVESGYARHAAAAASFAREFLDSDRVLARLLCLAGIRS